MHNRARWALLGAAWALTACAEQPEQLATRVEQALRNGDVDTLIASTQMQRTPAMLRFMLLDLPNDCLDGTVCSVKALPLDSAWVEESRANMAAEGVEFPSAAEGMIEIVGRAADDPNGDKGGMRMRMPYGKVDGHYKLLAAGYSAAKLAELQATTARAAAETAMAQGIYDPSVGENDMNWVNGAVALPADGGDPGRDFLASVRTMADAVAKNDVDAAATARGDWGKAILGAETYDGKPVPQAVRLRKLHAQAQRFVLEATVQGGWIKGDTAVLVIEGKNGAGSTVRGGVLMTRENDTWRDGGYLTIEIPAAN